MMPARCRVPTARASLVAMPMPSGQRQLRGARQTLLQRLAFVERHDRIQPRLPFDRQFDDLSDPQATHPRRNPRFADEGEAIRAFAGHARMRKLQHDLAAMPPVGRLEKAAVAAVREHVAKDEIVDDVAARRQIQDRKRRDRVREFVAIRRWQVHDVKHQRGDVVAAAGGERRVDQGMCQLLRRRALAQQLLDTVIGERAMDAVAAEQEPVVLPQADGCVVEAGELLEADGAVEQMGEVAAPGDMVLGQPLQASLAQPVGAGVADMDDMAKSSRQDHRRKGTAHAVEPRVDAALGVDPAIDALQRARGSAPHTKRFRQGIIGIDEAARSQVPRLRVRPCGHRRHPQRRRRRRCRLCRFGRDRSRRSPHWPVACRSRWRNRRELRDAAANCSPRLSQSPARVVRRALPTRRPRWCASGP